MESSIYLTIAKPLPSASEGEALLEEAAVRISNYNEKMNFESWNEIKASWEESIGFNAVSITMD
ncbi:hypothetical protein [uncultured Vibrio sp.]|uniref:hypothetical protein n=1 Tax=uncultured Vibrio sp. TaxID=114054 RepID=UPI0026197DF6|nr:hypothetical protein [uncultured Vibrio sp.]